MVRATTLEYQFLLAGYYDDFNGARVIPNDDNRPSLTADYEHNKTHYGNPLNGEATTNTRYRWSYADREQLGSNLVATASNKFLKNTGPAEWLTFDVMRNDPNKWEGRSQLQYPDSNTNANEYQFGAAGDGGYITFCNGHDTLNSYTVPTGDNDPTKGRSDRSPYTIVNYNAGTTSAPATSGSTASGYGANTTAFYQTTHLTGVWMGERNYDFSHFTTGSATENPEFIYTPHRSPGGKPFLCIEQYHQAATSSVISSVTRPAIAYDGLLNSRQDGDTFALRFALQSLKGPAGSTDGNEPKMVIYAGFPTSKSVDGEKGFDSNANTAAIEWTIDLAAATAANNGLGGAYDFTNVVTTWDSANYDASALWIDLEFVIDYTNNRYTVYKDGTAIKNTSGASGPFTMNNNSDTSAAFLPSAMKGWQVEVTPSSGSDTFSYFTLMLDRAGLYQSLSERADGTQLPPVRSMQVNSAVNSISRMQLQISDDPGMNTGTGAVGLRDQDYTHFLNNIFTGSVNDWSLLLFHNGLDRPLWWGFVDNMTIKQGPKSRTITLNANDPLGILDRQVPLWELGQGARNTSESGITYWTQESQTFNTAFYLGASPLKTLRPTIGLDVDDSYAVRTDQRTQVLSGMPIQMYNNEDTLGPNNIEDHYEGVGILGIGYESTTGDTRVFLDGNPGYTTGSTVNIEKTTSHNATGIQPQAVGTYTHNSTTKQFLDFDAGDVAYVFDPTPRYIYAGKYLWDGAGVPTATNASVRNHYCFIFLGDPALDVGDTFVVPEVKGHTNIQDKVHTVVAAAPYNNFFSQRVTVQSGYYNGPSGVSAGSRTILRPSAKLDLGSESFTDATRTNGPTLYVIVTDCYYGSGTEYGTFSNAAASTTNSSTIDPGDTTVSLTSASGFNASGSAAKPATVDFDGPFKDFFTYTGVSTNDLTGVPSSGDNGIVGYFPTVGGAATVTQPGWLYSTDRGIISSDTGIVTPIPSGVTDISHKASHAVWMRDLPKSLWFQYHFGNMVGNDILQLGPTNKTGRILTAVAVDAKVVEIDSGLYAQIPNSGVAQMGSTMSISGVLNGTSIEQQVDAMDLDTFIYRGKATSGGRYYLIGCDFISKAHDQFAFVGIATISDSYKHCWLLWADMRNDGTADADGSKRQKDFGIIEPTIENYELELFFADQVNADGNPDAFTDLKLGEDVDIWEIDSTIDPTTGGEWSKPPDYSTGAAVSGIADASGALRLTVTAGHGVVANDYIHVFNSLKHDNLYQVSAVTSTTITLGSGTYVAADAGNTGGIHFCKVTGSETETNSLFHDWESKAGAFLVIDSSKFFNLNTTVNKGRMYRSVGGRTSLGDYVATREGFPALIDNYWKEATPSHLTVGSPYGTHPNEERIAVEASSVDGSISNGDRHILIEDGSLFKKSGMGRVIGVKTDQTATNFVLWQQRVAAAHEGSVTANGLSGSHIYLLTDSSADFSALNEMIVNGHYPLIKNTTTGETSIVITIPSSTQIGVCKSTYTSASVPNEDLNDFPNISGWTSITNGNEYEIPMQLVGVFGSSLSNIGNAPNATYEEIENKLQKGFIDGHIRTNIVDSGGNTVTLLPNINFGMAKGTGTQDFHSISVVNSIGSPFSLRMLMRIRGFVESPNNGTFYESDKMRMLWNAALMKTWLPRTRLSCIHDIANVPNTTMLAVEGTTASATQDDFGSVFDARTKTFMATIRGIQGTSGLGRTQENQLNFAYLIGRDGRIEFRPRYNSGYAFDRSNLMVSDMKTDMGGMITHVRVYYKNGKSFCDFPRPSLSDTTRWKIIEMPGIVNHREAEALAKHEYRKAQKTRLSVTAEPIRSSTETNKMLSGGRFGYIADTQRILDHGGANTDTFVVGAGFSPFPGMVNAMDGNLKTTSGDIRYGQAAPYTAIGTSGTPARTDYDDHYYSYGANSLSYAMQVVHIPQDMPYVSGTTNNELRCFVVLKEQEVTSIDEAEFHLLMVDYSFSNSTTANGGGGSPAAALAPSLAGSEANSTTSVTVKNSGFYQLTVPQTYSSALNTAGAKIVVSFNAEYCRALLRHRCGNPTQTAHGSSGYILDNAHVLTGISALAYTAGNDNSLFPLGGRKYSEFGDFAYGRSEWYAPRLHVVNDVKFVPGTFATYTDKALQLANETMVIQQVGWEIKGRKIENVKLHMERDMNLPPSGVFPYIATMGINPRTGSSSGDGGSGTDSPQPTPYPDTNGPGDGAGGYGGSFPGLDPLPGNRPRPGLPDGGVTPPTNSPGGSHSPSFGANQLTSGIYGNMTGRMALDSDMFSGQGSFSILGQKKPSPLPSMMVPANGSGLDNIAPAFGGATKGDGDMTLPGVGNSDNTGDSSSGIQTSLAVPLNVVSDSINLTGVVSCSPNSTGSQRAVLTSTIECIETGETITNEIVVSVGTSKETIELIPNNLLNGASTLGNNVRVIVSRSPNTTNDTADYHSVKIHSLDVLFDQAAFNTPGLNQQFKSFS
jgi:hypothetical protein